MWTFKIFLGENDLTEVILSLLQTVASVHHRQRFEVMWPVTLATITMVTS